MITMPLNSQVRQYDGFTPGRRVFGRTPEVPIGAVGNPFFEYLMNPAAAPTAKTQNLISTLFKLRQASLNADFQSKMDTTPIRRVRNAKTGEYLLGVVGAVFFTVANRKKQNCQEMGRARNKHWAFWE